MGKKIYFLIVGILLIASATAYTINLKKGIEDLVLEDNGGVPVNIQDQATNTVDAYFSKNESGPYPIAVDTTPNNRTIILVNATGLTAGDLIGLFQDSTNPASYFGTIDSISSNTLTMKEPLDQNFFAGQAIAFELDNDLSNGCTGGEVLYVINNDASEPVDITRVIWSMTTDSIPDLNEFGDIVGGIDNGLLLRVMRNDGTYNNIFTFRTNKDFKVFSYDYETFLASNPAQAVNGLAVRSTFAGQEKHGVVVRLNANEALQLLCQDDLTDILTFNVLAQGHVTQD